MEKGLFNGKRKIRPALDNFGHVAPYNRIVPEKRSRIHEVVVVRRYSPGYWEFGVGREWERAEKGEVSLRLT
jgi:hypothetical protein